MSTAIEWPVLLTVRGKTIPKTLEEMRGLHNQTAGSAPGIAAARALGDLSHKVFSPNLRMKQSGAAEGELLFLDVWVRPQGIFEFFSNEQVIQQGTKLFSSRDATVWMRAEGSFSYSLPAPMGKSERLVGMVRGPVASPERAIEIFRGVDQKAQPDARKRGLLSHEIFIKLRPPGDESPLELLGLDHWCDSNGMLEHYADQTHMAALASAFSGPPQPSAWEQAPGDWSEW